MKDHNFRKMEHIYTASNKLSTKELLQWVKDTYPGVFQTTGAVIALEWTAQHVSMLVSFDPCILAVWSREFDDKFTSMPWMCKFVRTAMPVYTVVWSHNCFLFAVWNGSSGASNVCVFETQTLAPYHVCKDKDSPAFMLLKDVRACIVNPQCMDFSHDNKYLAITGTQCIRVWKLTRPFSVVAVCWHTAGRVAWSPDDKRLAFSGFDSEIVHVWRNVLTKPSDDHKRLVWDGDKLVCDLACEDD